MDFEVEKEFGIVKLSGSLLQSSSFPRLNRSGNKAETSHDMRLQCYHGQRVRRCNSSAS
jgi:hypothetical protein